ncbi:MAG: glycoside hydrolase family 13 protein [Saprospiraceae bacterium]|nr:glycoside hydrolase family 13 protein [Saprospiraceae bacterium]
MRFILLFSILFLSVNCKNYFGNPYPKSAPPHVSPVRNEMRVEPGNWWVGMKHNWVEIMIHRDDVASYQVKLGPTKGVKLRSVEKAESPNYLFITLDIAASAKAQTVPIIFTKGTESFTHPYPILNRRPGPKGMGVNPKDIIYLIFPDRFSNGDPSNDNVAGMHQGLQRDSLVGRHGGDLQGIINHLDYLQDLGITAIWLNPELENDQKRESYHGYAVTDHYRVDRRFGTNDLLRELVQKCHERGIKVVRDVVLNHIGSEHWWMQDLPSKDWINQWPVMTQTTYRAPTLLDPYASEWDKKRFSDGWFVPTMPDLNQRNPHVANYLIQQAIWWMEYAGLDDFRIDTYTYSDQAFCSRWCKEVREEYPNLNMFGEIWEHGVSVQGFFADDQPLKSANFDSNLPSVVDFQLCFAIHEALSREQGWTEGISRVYYTLAKDRFYKNANMNVTMLDNHDFSRFYTIVKEDYNKYKSGMAFLLTTRGIPQIYYMTEILGTGNEWPSHGNIRKDFPGGWPGDPANKFTAAGRTAQENDAYNYARALIQYRKNNQVLQTGKLTQFVPVDGVYVYFRHDASKTVMVILNTANSERTVDTARFAERMTGFSKAKDVATGAMINDLSKLTLERNSPLVLELMR